jgi:hypothetical protein
MSNELPEMNEISISQCVDTIQYLGNDVPCMVWGEPGCGKTQTIQSVFTASGYKVIPVLAGQSEPTDIQGIPFPDEKNVYAEYLIPWWGFLVSNHPDVPEEHRGDTVLFFDDIVTAHEQTQAAFYKLVDEGYLGKWAIRDNVRIIAAGNRVDDMSAVVDMPKALCNRFMHFYVKPNLDAWLDWAPKAGVHPHVIFYLRKIRSNLSCFADACNSTTTHAWASPRTWEMVSKALFKLDESGLRGDSNNAFDYEFAVVQGSIGKLAHEFLTLIRNSFSIVDPEEIVKNPETCEVPEMTDPDRMYATVTSLEHYFASDPDHYKHYEAVLKYATRLPDEFGILLAKQFITVVTGKMDDKLREGALASDSFFATMDKYEEKLSVRF